VDEFGVGAKVKVELTNGKKFKGSIQSIEDGGFVLAAAKAGSPTRVRYDNVAQLNLTKNTYKATGQPDSVEVRRVVAELGVGHHIMVKTTAGKEYHGNIQAIRSDGFTMLPDHQTAPVEIAYSDTTDLGPNMSRGEKIATIALVAGVVLLVLYLVGRTQVK
jgi:small nuclear ribonucleoprotein (snRNP)-like protein